jgi:hypothetical protein
VLYELDGDQAVAGASGSFSHPGIDEFNRLGSERDAEIVGDVEDEIGLVLSAAASRLRLAAGAGDTADRHRGIDSL